MGSVPRRFLPVHQAFGRYAVRGMHLSRLSRVVARIRVHQRPAQRVEDQRAPVQAGEEGIYDAAQAVAVKRVLAFQLERDMQKAQLTKTAMAKRMGTTRAQLDRLLNPENPATTLQTLVKAAGALAKRVKISLVNA